MTYEKIKILNNQSKKDLLNYLHFYKENDKKIQDYQFKIISVNKNYCILESISTKENFYFYTINDLISFFRDNFAYIINISLLRNNKLPFVITTGILRKILNVFDNSDTSYQVNYYFVNSLDIIKAKISLFGGDILLDYHDSILAIYKDNIVYLYTDNICKIKLEAYNYLINKNIKTNLVSVPIMVISDYNK